MENLCWKVLIILFLSGCAKDRIPSTHNQVNSTCDTTNITFNNGLSAIMNQYCNSCHDTPGGKGDFSDYNSLKSKIDNGSFYNRVFDVKDMPPGGNISACDLLKIKQWLDKGAPQ